MMRNKKRNEGTALLMAIVLVFILGITSAALWRYLHATMHQGRLHEKIEAAQCLAEAGLEKAVAELRVRPASYRGEDKTPLGKGLFSVRVHEGHGPGQYRIVATGALSDGTVVLARRTLEAKLCLSPTGDVLAYARHKKKR